MIQAYIDWVKESKRFKKAIPYLNAKPGFKDFFYWRQFRFSTFDDSFRSAPWYSRKTIVHLKRIMDGKTLNVFEWGSGGSTIWFGQQGHHIVSIEYDVAWYTKVEKQIHAEGLSNQIDLKLCEPHSKPGGEIKVLSDRMPGVDFLDYLNAIDSYDAETFDLIVVDGRARAYCLQKALKHIKEGGYLLLDNADRPEYINDELFPQALNQWPRVDFCGPVFGHPYLTGAIIWKKE